MSSGGESRGVQTLHSSERIRYLNARTAPVIRTVHTKSMSKQCGVDARVVVSLPPVRQPSQERHRSAASVVGGGEHHCRCEGR